MSKGAPALVEERTREWLAAQLRARAAEPDAPGFWIFGTDGEPQGIGPAQFQELLRKLEIFRLLDRMSFDSFIDIGAGYDHVPQLVRARYGVPAYYGDFSHAFNLPLAGEADDRLDRAVTLNIVRLPFPDDAFDVVLCSEVLEHLVRPIECIAELLRVTRRYLIMTSLEALAPTRGRRWLSHLRVDVRHPHVERNFFVLPELEAVFGPDWLHQSLFVDSRLPCSVFAPPAAQLAGGARFRSRAALATGLVRGLGDGGHPPDGMGILLVKRQPGAPPLREPGDPLALAHWLLARRVEAEAAGRRLLARLREDDRPAIARERPVAADLVDRLRCPDCGARVEPAGSGLRCTACAAAFPGEYGVPIVYPARAEARPPEAWLPAMSGGDTRRARTIRRLVGRLRRNEAPPSRLRRALWRVLPS